MLSSGTDGDCTAMIPLLFCLLCSRRLQVEKELVAWFKILREGSTSDPELQARDLRPEALRKTKAADNVTLAIPLSARLDKKLSQHC